MAGQEGEINSRETTQERIVGERKIQLVLLISSSPLKKFFGPNVTVGLKKVDLSTFFNQTVTLTGQKTFWRAKRLVVIILASSGKPNLTQQIVIPYDPKSWIQKNVSWTGNVQNLKMTKTPQLQIQPHPTVNAAAKWKQGSQEERMETRNQKNRTRNHGRINWNSGTEPQSYTETTPSSETKSSWDRKSVV